VKVDDADVGNSGRSQALKPSGASKQKAVLVINTKSRRGREWIRPAVETLRQAANIDLLETHTLTQPGRISHETEKAIANGVPLVIVGGGDGTLSAVVGSFIGSNSVLGVLPLGTGNQFARDLGIDADVESACRLITEGMQADVDVGIVNDRYFLNVATVGLSTRIAREMTVDAKRRLGRMAYLFALVKALRRVKPFRARITIDNEKNTFETLQVVAGNGRFHGGPFPLASDASITSGKLVVYALVGTSRWELLRYAAKLPGGHQGDLQNVISIHTSGGQLEATPVQKVTVDGETQLRTPLSFGIAPSAVRVMVPQEFERDLKPDPQ
jgi:diacylglycerol kinase (ATP)